MRTQTSLRMRKHLVIEIKIQNSETLADRYIIQGVRYPNRKDTKNGVMSVNLPADHVEVAALRERVKHISEENKFVNNENDYLQESNGGLAIENNKLKKTLALTEERLQRITDFWRSAAMELTKQIAINEDLTKQLEA